ncbi:MAG TPA: site-2 protease family protein [Chloroflexota bacterium]|jgi:Zn-dependent protease/CBS domain-containing protein|nr:site-2 protease family protein [Chloroflexota bacterium]
MHSSIQLGRIAGIPVGIHYTWLVAFALVAWSLAAGFFPLNYPGWAPLAYWVTGVVAALGLFGCVLLHELSHSLVARARGHGVHSITLFIFGGVSNIAEESENPADEFWISVVGPLTSFALAVLAWLLTRLVALPNTPLGALLAYLAVINLMLGVFNLLPGFPLDGGRVLRSLLWATTGSLYRATQVASYVGQGFGFLLIFWGLWQLLSGNFLGGLWIAFIGWFLNGAAETVRQQQVLKERLQGVRVAELMNPRPPIASPALSVQDFVCTHVMREGHRALLVEDEAGRLLGIVSITDAREVPQAQWATTPVGAIMTRVPLKTVAPDTALADALQLLVEHGLNQLPVLAAGRAVGLLSRADIIRYLQLREELNRRGAGGRRP